jgi:hypothetical protein
MMMMDDVAEYYSKPQDYALTSYRQIGGGPFSRIGKYAIPLWRGIKNKIVGASQGVAEAVSEAGGAAVKKFVKQVPKQGLKRALEEGGEKFKKKIHKRSRLDDALGDDTY